MTYIITLILGLLLGILTLYVLRPGFFVKNPQEFQTLETLFEQYMEEMDEKQEQWRQEQEQLLDQLRQAEQEAVQTRGSATRQAINPKPQTLSASSSEEPNSAWRREAASNHPFVSNTPPLSSEQPGNTTKEKRRVVEELAEQGWGADKIARHLSLGRGEVSLILQLKKR